MKNIFVSIIFTFCLIQISAQNHYARFKSIDIQHYDFEIHLNDSTDRIEGKTTVQVKFLQPAKTIILDLTGTNDSTETGMEVSKIIYKGNATGFNHRNNQLEIDFNTFFEPNQIISFDIFYAGVPSDGLIISKNKFGDRTFFADNWPDLAHHWIPCVDHPSDKATIDFRVFAPEKYQVISNGFQVEESNIENGFKYTHWKESVPVSTKIMVIGVARFAVLNNETRNEIPLSSWVYPQNREEGFNDYAIASKPFQYFTEIIGPYSYEKLAHVQSNTRYGGMENASCIFYSERSVTGKNRAERLIAHETAHQWFGNSVTEQNWHHVWLSEGFATYLTHVYNQHFQGEEYFREGLKGDRERVIRYSKRNLAPIIDTTVTEYINLLNTNSYQKASWFLHMLRENVGDTIFFKGLQKFYIEFQNSTALTEDFQKVMETTSGKDLDMFFQQWLWQPGCPKIKLTWKQKKDNTLVLKIEQVQEEYLFQFPFEIEYNLENGETKIKTVDISERKNEFQFSFNGKIETVKPDPKVKLLFEEVP